MNNTDNFSTGTIPVSDSFHKRILSLNNLDNAGLKEWVFHPAMLFGSPDGWWGDREKRQRAHEGLDLCVYRTDKDVLCYLNESIKVPVIFKGRVIKIIDDFLGSSVFVRHDIRNENGKSLYTIYGHIKPGAAEGQQMNGGDIIGTIAPVKKKNTAIPHLHISAAWIPDTIEPQKLDWQKIGNDAGVILLDPLDVVRLPCSISENI